MNQEKFGKLIKDIRKKNNLTQKQLAAKYNVTYQAVSKWENGLNMPDTYLIKQISKDFGISIDELLDGEYKEEKNNKKYIMIIIIFVILSLILLIVVKSFQKDNGFQFKTLSTECKDFNISGNISYNQIKSAIYITNIKYCGGDDMEEYKTIECILYESNGDMERKISSFKSNHEKIKLENFLQEVTLTVDNYDNTCKEYEDDSLFLSINATTYDNKTINYKIPLKLESCLK